MFPQPPAKRPWLFISSVMVGSRHFLQPQQLSSIIYPASASLLPSAPQLLLFKCQLRTHHTQKQRECRVHLTLEKETAVVWWDMTVPVLYDKHQYCPLTALLAYLCSPPFGSGARAWWQRARARGGEQLGCQHWTGDQHCWQALQDGVPKPYVSQVHCRSPHLETCLYTSYFRFLSVV